MTNSKTNILVDSPSKTDLSKESPTKGDNTEKIRKSMKEKRNASTAQIKSTEGSEYSQAKSNAPMTTKISESSSLLLPTESTKKKTRNKQRPEL